MAYFARTGQIFVHMLFVLCYCLTDHNVMKMIIIFKETPPCFLGRLKVIYTRWPHVQRAFISSVLFWLFRVLVVPIS